MHKVIILFLLFLLLNGCSLNNLFQTQESQKKKHRIIRKKSNSKTHKINNQKETSISNHSKKGYIYYLKNANFSELSSYLSHKNTQDNLSYTQYTHLQQRTNQLEKKIFTQGSLEELIFAYKRNKNPKYKERIMVLMKNTQEKQ